MYLIKWHFPWQIDTVKSIGVSLGLDQSGYLVKLLQSQNFPGFVSKFRKLP